MVGATRAGPASRSILTLRNLIAGFLWLTAVALLLLGSADAPIDTRNSAFWFRSLRSIPGLVDACGDFTWAARMVPPALALAGGAVWVVRGPRRASSWGAAAFGLLLAVGLAYATTQNAVPWGEVHCIID